MLELLNIKRKEKAVIKYLVFQPNINLRSNGIAHIYFISEAVKYLYRNIYKRSVDVLFLKTVSR